MRSAITLSQIAAPARCRHARGHQSSARALDSTASVVDAIELQEEDDLDLPDTLDADGAETALEREADHLADEALRQLASDSEIGLDRSRRPAPSAPTISESDYLPDP